MLNNVKISRVVSLVVLQTVVFVRYGGTHCYGHTEIYRCYVYLINNIFHSMREYNHLSSPLVGNMHCVS
jgi:hypothetical protein